MVVTIETVDLLSVAGRLDGDGLRRLQSNVDALLDGGAHLLVADLSGVTGCDGRLFDLLSRTSHLVEYRGGWLRLVGVGPPVLNALNQAALPQVLLVYRASGWASHGSAELRRAATERLHSAVAPTSAHPRRPGTHR
jgi:anti-anti-sigma regulatory factor